ncbi:MAG: alpha/beta hydrolase-fold protein [Coprobacillus sp.]
MNTSSKKFISLLMAGAIVFTGTLSQFSVKAEEGNTSQTKGSESSYKAGATVEENKTGKSDADYQLTFVYEDTDEKDATKVTVSGNLQFYSLQDEVVKNFINTGVATGAKEYDVYQYKDGMFNTGYGLNSDTAVYELTETKDERFEITLPVPGNLYYYDYTITYGDGSTKTIQDPVNPSPKNKNNNHNSNHSMVYVGNGSNTTAGQEQIYAQSTTKGSFSYSSYTATDGTKQPLGIYLPNGYDSSKVYKTIYVSHGGGGNEAEWMGIGALPNIMDNLMSSKDVAQAVVVTMDNTYFSWDYDKIAKNFKENIIPYVEKNYNVSLDSQDRALCGLSMGSMTTSTIMQSYTDLFSYYGCFSGANVAAAVKDVDLLKDVTIYLTAGNIDMALMNNSYGTPTDRTTNGLRDKLDNLGVKYTFDTKNGAHDWGMWRDALTTFTKDFLWDNTDNTIKYNSGVTVEKNTNPKWNADYVATFIYKDQDKRDAVSVNVQGGFQFYKENEVSSYKGGTQNKSIPCYDAYQYEKGMFAGSSSTKTDAMIPYEMKEITDEVFEVKIPVPANQYFYSYYVTYEGKDEAIKVNDPANMPIKSPSGSDAGWSTFYVGKSGETKGQEYIYPRSDKNGKVEYKEYKAVDGTTQYVGVYTPYGYDKNKTYKTIYVSHGGGGNENEWMTIGSIPNIMDNLIAKGEMAEAIVVTMNNTYFNWDYDKVLPNVVKNIVPFIESNYSVSKESKDRAFCGLSMGSMTTNQMAKTYPNEFGYFGSFSGGSTDLDKSHYDVKSLNNAVLYLTAGNIDMAYNNNMGISSVDYMKMYDELGIKYDFDLLLGSHDWYVWRESFTTFAKDYLWDVENTKIDTPKEEVSKPNTNDAVKTDDESYTELYVMGLLFGFAGLTSLYISKKRKESL